MDNTFPFGLPKETNWKNLLTSVMKVTNAVTMARKTKGLTRIQKTGLFNDYLDRISPSHKGLSDKQRSTVLMFSEPTFRAEIRDRSNADSFGNTIEGYFISQYARLKGYAGAREMLNQEQFVKEPEYEVGRDDIVLMKSLVTNGLPNQNDRSILAELLPMVVEDLSGENEKVAAHCLFGIASMCKSRLLIDYIYFTHPEIHKKYFRELSYDGLESLFKGTPEFECQFGSEEEFTSFKNSMFFQKVTKGLMAMGAEMAISNLIEEDRSWSDEGKHLQDLIDKTRDKLGVMKKDLVGSEVLRAKDGVRYLLEEMNLAHEKLSSCGIDYVKERFNLASKKVELFREHINASNYSDIDLFGLTFFETYEKLTRTKMKIDKMREGLTKKAEELSANPVANRVELKDVFEDIDQLEKEGGEALDKRRKEFDSVISEIIDYDIEADVVELEDDGDKTEVFDMSIEEQEMEDELIAGYREQVSELTTKMLQLNESVQAERDQIGEIRRKKNIEGMREDIREVMQKVFVDVNSCSVEELLMAVAYLYPEDVVVLPSAVKSAQNCSCDAKEVIWDSLKKLALDYRSRIADGLPDSEARKVFPVKMFAANESETTIQNGELREKRSQMYNGEKHCFDRHIRIGISHNTRETARIHFKMIDGKLVISHCGEHMDKLSK